MPTAALQCSGRLSNTGTSVRAFSGFLFVSKGSSGLALMLEGLCVDIDRICLNACMCLI